MFNRTLELLEEKMGTGKFWQNLLKTSFEKARFFDSSDTKVIAKVAARETVEAIKSELSGKVSAETMLLLEEAIQKIDQQLDNI